MTMGIGQIYRIARAAIPAKPKKPAAATAVGSAPEPELELDAPPAPPAAVVVAAPEPPVDEAPDPVDCHTGQFLFQYMSDLSTHGRCDDRAIAIGGCEGSQASAIASRSTVAARGAVTAGCCAIGCTTCARGRVARASPSSGGVT